MTPFLMGIKTERKKYILHPSNTVDKSKYKSKYVSGKSQKKKANKLALQLTFKKQ